MPTPKTKKPVKKIVAKVVPAKNGKSLNGKKNGASAAAPKPAAAAPPKPAPAPEPRPDAKLQLKAFERGIQLLYKHKFKDAKEMFERSTHGPSLEMAANAQSHIRMCDRRLAAPAPEPKSAEEHYNYGVALINLRDLEKARKHLGIALEMEPRADHLHYAFSVCQALSGDAPGAYDSLKRAIELQPRNRMVARQDSDLDAVSSQPRFSRLLYPEKNL
jgi:tetratricopeptide (TPR) repeat protein